jgi:hypothetical protein
VSGPKARLLLVGAVSPGFDLDRRLQRLGLSDQGIVREAYVEEDRLWSLMAACDVCVSLRSPTMGETSGSVIRQLSLGKPVIVSDVGWFSELPGEVALKVPVDAGETESLYAALELWPETTVFGRRCRRRRPRSSGASTTWAAWPISTPLRSSRRPAERRSQMRFSTMSPVRLQRSGSRRGRPRPSSWRGAWPRSSLVDRFRAVPAWAWLAAIVVLSFAVRAWLAREMLGPFIMVDELIYSELGRSVAAGDGFQVRGAAASGFSLVYPILISPAYALYDSLPEAYAAVKTINALLMSLTAVPVYLLARRLLAPPLSLLAALLAVALPSLAYTGTVMTENIFYPLFVTAALQLVLVLERPTPARQLGLLAWSASSSRPVSRPSPSCPRSSPRRSCSRCSESSRWVPR